MSPSKSVALVAALCGLSMATPVDIQNKKQFTVDQVAVPKKQALAPAQHRLKAYAKYGKLSSAPAELIAAASTGTVAANPEANDRAYLSPVNVGGTTLNLDFDTGSADLWVFSRFLPSSESSGHATYSPSSSAQRLSGYSWSITYGDQSGASGTVYADKVAVGAVTATRQAVEAATSVSSQFQEDTDNDGLLGLAFSSINTVSPTKQTTFFDTVKGQLAKALFAVRLRKGQAGSYDFGFIDSSKYSGSISYVPVDSSRGFWGFTAGAYSVNGRRGSSVGAAIADTGTTLLLLPSSVVSAYYGQTQSGQNNPNVGGYTVDCNEALPDFKVTIGSGTFTVPGSYINFADAGDGTCYGGIQSNSGIGFTIFGDIFLKAHFVVFDQSTGSPRLGFATGA